MEVRAVRSPLRRVVRPGRGQLACSWPHCLTSTAQSPADRDHHPARAPDALVLLLVPDPNPRAPCSAAVLLTARQSSMGLCQLGGALAWHHHLCAKRRAQRPPGSGVRRGAHRVLTRRIPPASGRAPPTEPTPVRPGDGSASAPRSQFVRARLACGGYADVPGSEAGVEVVGPPPESTASPRDSKRAEHEAPPQASTPTPGTTGLSSSLPTQSPAVAGSSGAT